MVWRRPTCCALWKESLHVKRVFYVAGWSESELAGSGGTQHHSSSTSFPWDQWVFNQRHILEHIGVVGRTAVLSPFFFTRCRIWRTWTCEDGQGILFPQPVWFTSNCLSRDSTSRGLQYSKSLLFGSPMQITLIQYKYRPIFGCCDTMWILLRVCSSRKP